VEPARQGAPLEEEVDVGAMTMPNAWVKLEDLVKDAVAKGARLLAGGKRLEHPTWTHGFYFAPTVLVDVTTDMKIAQEEVFGPVVVIMRFTTDEEALRIVNCAPYGLGASVFSSNAERAERLVSGIRSGMCNVNDFAVNYLCQSLPFGGVKISGFDRFAGPEGLRGNCLVRVRQDTTPRWAGPFRSREMDGAVQVANRGDRAVSYNVPQAITTDRIPGVKTDIPKPLNYPIGKNGFPFVAALCTMAYGQLGESLLAIAQMLRLL